MSQWDKLLEKLKNLSADLRFEESKRFLNTMNIRWILPKVEVVIILFVRKGRGLSRYQSINQLRKCILNLLEMLLRRRNNNGIRRLPKAKLQVRICS